MSNSKKDIKIHSVKYNFLMNVILKISQYIFPLITLPYITRTLGSVGNGKVAFTSSVIAYFSMFSQMGIPSYGVRECARCRDDKDLLTKTVHEILFLNCIFVLIAYVMLAISIMFVAKFQQEPVLLLIYSVTLILNMLGMEWLYQAIEQYQYITIRNILFKTLSVALMFVLVHKPKDYVLYAVLTVFGLSCSNILNLWNAGKILKHKLYISEYSFRKHLKPIFTFFAISVAVSIYTNMDTVMLGFISGDEQVAYYALSVKIKMVLATTVSALGPVLIPRITYCLSNGQIKKFNEYIRKSTTFVLFFSIPITLFFVLMAPEVIDVLGGQEYMPATLCMIVITFSVIPLGVGNVACSQILVPTGNEKLVTYSTLCGAIVNFIVNLVLIPHFQAVGAAFATVIAEIAVASIQVYFSWCKIKDSFKKIPWTRLIVANLMAFFVMFFSKIVLRTPYCLLNIILIGTLYFITYAFFLILLKCKKYFFDFESKK